MWSDQVSQPADWELLNPPAACFGHACLLEVGGYWWNSGIFAREPHAAKYEMPLRAGAEEA